MDIGDLKAVTLTGGFLYEKERLVRDVTLPALLASYRETGRLEALKHRWVKGGPNRPHIFWDSDLAKWIEGASYAYATSGDPWLAEEAGRMVDDIVAGQRADGYFNSYYQSVDPSGRFSDRNDHELYCAGHLMEAAVAYHGATGRRELLDAMRRYADHIESVFTAEGRDPSFATPGHEEIELALYRLYKATGEGRYLRLSEHFINKRGHSDGERVTFHWYGKEYAQDHLPVREQRTAEGHSVRALYLYSAMADLALELGDAGLRAACEAVHESMVGRRMYVTGGLGGNYHGESFSYDYDLPNETAYAETCASIAFAQFAGRMYLLGRDPKYYEAMELMVYNNISAGLSASGDGFFYCNPLEAHPDRRDYHASRGRGQFAPEYERPKDYACSCCPPNVIRFLSSVKGRMYRHDPDRLYVNLYGSSTYARGGVSVTQETDYPWDGAVTLRVSSMPDGVALSLRIPEWCRDWSLTVDGASAEAAAVGGYATLRRAWRGGEEVRLDLAMPVEEMHANPMAHHDMGKIAVKRGPVVYCAEGADNPGGLRSACIEADAGYRLEGGPFGAPAVSCAASFPKGGDDRLYSAAPFGRVGGRLTLIPYAMWANRGRNEMAVWLHKG